MGLSNDIEIYTVIKFLKLIIDEENCKEGGVYYYMFSNEWKINKSHNVIKFVKPNAM